MGIKIDDWVRVITTESVKEPDLFCSLEMGKVLDKVRHAIGLRNYGNNGRLYHRHGKLYYKAYRNYYDAGGDDVPIWEALVIMGYAYKSRVYHLSESGFKWFEQQTGVIVRREGI